MFCSGSGAWISICSQYLLAKNITVHAIFVAEKDVTLCRFSIAGWAFGIGSSSIEKINSWRYFLLGITNIKKRRTNFIVFFLSILLIIALFFVQHFVIISILFRLMFAYCLLILRLELNPCLSKLYMILKDWSLWRMIPSCQWYIAINCIGDCFIFFFTGQIATTEKMTWRHNA